MRLRSHTYCWQTPFVWILLACAWLALPAAGDDAIPTLDVFPKLKNAVKILASPDGIWVGCYGTGIWHFQGDTWIPVTFPDPDDKFIVSMTLGPDGQLYAVPWMGKGIYQIDAIHHTANLIAWPTDSPKWSREYARPIEIFPSGRFLYIPTFAGMVIYHLDGKQWTISEETFTATAYARFTPDTTGYWSLESHSLSHRTLTGVCDTVLPLTDDTRANTYYALTMEETLMHLGGHDGQWSQVSTATRQLQKVLARPRGVEASLLCILPTRAVTILAYGNRNFTVDPEPDSGAIVAYNPATKQAILIAGLGNWKDLAATDTDVWAAGKAGVMRIPFGLIYPLVHLPGPRVGIPSSQQIPPGDRVQGDGG